MTLKYGIINKTYPPQTYPQRVPLAASQTLRKLYGRFLTIDGSGNFALSATTDSQIDGWTEDVFEDAASSSTAAIDTVALVDDLSCVFEMPVLTTYTLTAATLKLLMHKTCDLYTTTSYQYVDPTASTYDVVKIVGGDVKNQTLYVRINPTKMFTAGAI